MKMLTGETAKARRLQATAKVWRALRARMALKAQTGREARQALSTAAKAAKVAKVCPTPRPYRDSAARVRVDRSPAEAHKEALMAASRAAGLKAVAANRAAPLLQTQPGQQLLRLSRHL